MNSLFKWISCALAFTSAMICSQSYAAPCTLVSASQASGTIVYDPFGATGVQQVNLNLTVTRNQNSGNKGQWYNFILTSPVVPAGMTVSANIGGTTYSNILYSEGAIPSGLPTLTATNLSGQALADFGGAAQPNTMNISMQVTIPPGTDLSAAKDISFNIVYVCKGTGGSDSVSSPVTLANAATINIDTLSALRTYYAGEDLNFGEIGQVTTASLASTPVRTAITNYISVLSSGAYNVGLSSQNGFLLKNGGGTANDQIAYQLKFLGNVYSNVTAPPSPTAIRDCQRASLTTANQLYLQAGLLEGGTGKNPSPNYTDTLTVTVTPNINTDIGSVNCATLSGFLP